MMSSLSNGASLETITGIASAPSASALTVITTSVTIIPAPRDGSQAAATVVATTISVTNSAQLATSVPSTLSTSSTRSVSASSTSKQPSATTTEPTAAPARHGSSISTGAIAGIAIAIAGALVIAVILFVWRRRKMQNARRPAPGGVAKEVDDVFGEKAELPADGAKKGGVITKAELFTNANRHEIDGSIHRPKNEGLAELE